VSRSLRTVRRGLFSCSTERHRAFGHNTFDGPTQSKNRDEAHGVKKRNRLLRASGVRPAAPGRPRKGLKPVPASLRRRRDVARWNCSWGLATGLIGGTGNSRRRRCSTISNRHASGASPEKHAGRCPEFSGHPIQTFPRAWFSTERGPRPDLSARMPRQRQAARNRSALGLAMLSGQPHHPHLAMKLWLAQRFGRTGRTLSSTPAHAAGKAVESLEHAVRRPR
jgi:hypothetical protein